MDKSNKRVNCINNYPVFMKEVNNVDVLERRIRLCKKRVTFTRSFLLTDSFHNVSNILSPSIRKTLKYTKRLEIHCAQQTKSFSKLFPYINKLKVVYSDIARDHQRESPKCCYEEIARSFHSGIWKKLKSLDMFIEDQHNPIPLRTLLISLRCNNKIKESTVDLALYLINYINNLDSMLAFLTNSKNLEILSLKNMYFLSKTFCDELSSALCKQAKLRVLELIIYDDDGKKPFYSSNLTYFVESIKELISLEAIEIGFFSSSDSSLIDEIANGFKFWDRLKKVSLQFDNKISEINRETWISFYDNLSELTSLKVLSLEFLNLTLPLWRLISKSISLLENLEQVCIGFSEGMEAFVRDFYCDLGAALNRFKKLKNLTLILPFTNNSYYEKIFPALKRCKLTNLKIITSMNSSQLSELESLTEFLKNQEELIEVYLDLNCSKRAKFPMFSFDSTKSLLGVLAKLSKLTQITLKFGGIENKFINIFKDFESLPSHLLSLNIDIRRKSLTDQELVSLIKGLNRLHEIEHFHLNADFGNITEETFSLFYRSMFQIKSVNNVNIQAVNAILPGIVYLK